jgi:hypothetical protein
VLERELDAALGTSDLASLQQACHSSWPLHGPRVGTFVWRSTRASSSRSLF